LLGIIGGALILKYAPMGAVISFVGAPALFTYFALFLLINAGARLIGGLITRLVVKNIVSPLAKEPWDPSNKSETNITPASPATQGILAYSLYGSTDEPFYYKNDMPFYRLRMKQPSGILLTALQKFDAFVKNSSLLWLLIGVALLTVGVFAGSVLPIPNELLHVFVPPVMSTLGVAIIARWIIQLKTIPGVLKEKESALSTATSTEIETPESSSAGSYPQFSSSSSLSPAEPPAYPQQLSTKNFYLSALLAAVLLATAVSMVFLMFVGRIPYAWLPWAMPLTLLATLGSLIVGMRLLKKRTKVGVYGEWVAMAAMLTTIFSTLTVLMGFALWHGLGVVGFSIPLTMTGFAVVSGLAVGSLVLLGVTWRVAEKRQEGEADGLFAKNTLTVIKSLTICGLLFVAYLTATILAGWQFPAFFGVLSDPMWFAIQVIRESLGRGGVELGAQWLNLFLPMIFGICMAGATALLGNVLQPSESDVYQNKKLYFQMPTWQKAKIWARKLFKLMMICGIIFAMLWPLLQSGATLGILMPYAVVALMSMLPVKAEFGPLALKETGGFGYEITRFYNYWLGTSPVESKEQPLIGPLLSRELCKMFFFAIPWAITGFALNETGVIFLVNLLVNVACRVPDFIRNCCPVLKSESPDFSGERDISAYRQKIKTNSYMTFSQQENDSTNQTAYLEPNSLYYRSQRPDGDIVRSRTGSCFFDDERVWVENPESKDEHDWTVCSNSR
jgi:hypothetical protein